MLDTTAAVEQALAAHADPADLQDEALAATDEFRRRCAWLSPEETLVLFEWYVEGKRPGAIAVRMNRSVRHIYRVRTSAIARIVAMGQVEEFADANVADFA